MERGRGEEAEVVEDVAEAGGDGSFSGSGGAEEEERCGEEVVGEEVERLFAGVDGLG